MLNDSVYINIQYMCHVCICVYIYTHMARPILKTNKLFLRIMSDYLFVCGLHVWDGGGTCRTQETELIVGTGESCLINALVFSPSSLFHFVSSSLLVMENRRRTQEEEISTTDRPCLAATCWEQTGLFTKNHSLR